MKTREEILSHRSEKDEYTFGIQRFDNPEDAFNVMDDSYDPYDGRTVVIGKDKFLDAVFEKTYEVYGKYLTGEYSDDRFRAALGVNDEYTSDDLLDFNFFFYCKENNCYYTSLMEFKDDYMSVLSDRQWEIFYEIYGTLNLRDYVTGIINLINEKLAEKDDEFKDEMIAWGCDDGMAWFAFDDLYPEYINLDKKYQIFGYGGELKYPKIVQNKYRVFVDPNWSGGDMYIKDTDDYDEAERCLIESSEDCLRKCGQESWDTMYKQCFFIRDNSCGEKIYFDRVWQKKK